jgi:hypothetical protein
VARVTAILLILALPMLLAGAMIDPGGLHLGGLIAFAAIVFVALPFVAWPSLLLSAVFVPAGASRLRSVVTFWIGASVTATAVIWFIGSVLSYPRPGTAIDPSGHLLIPFAPRFGLALGLWCLSLLVSCGCWGAIAPIPRPQVALMGALISGCVLFLVVYGAGWLLVS